MCPEKCLSLLFMNNPSQSFRSSVSQQDLFYSFHSVGDRSGSEKRHRASGGVRRRDHRGELGSVCRPPSHADSTPTWPGSVPGRVTMITSQWSGGHGACPAEADMLKR